MTHREITRFGWTAQDNARAERMRPVPAVTDPAVEAEVERVQWEGQPTPWFAAGTDVQTDRPQVTVLRGAASGISHAAIKPRDGTFHIVGVRSGLKDAIQNLESEEP